MGQCYVNEKEIYVRIVFLFHFIGDQLHINTCVLSNDSNQDNDI